MPCRFRARRAERSPLLPPQSLRAWPLALALLGIVIFAGGCVPKKADMPGQEGQAQALWNSFATGMHTDAKALSVTASLGVQHPRKSARLLVKFWGNLNGPLRLDLSTGMGQLYSMWREDSLGWLGIYPLSKQAFTHADTKAAFSRLGMPFPFSLKDLAAIAAGRMETVIGTSFKSVRKTPKGYEYTLVSPAAASVTLDFEGRPMQLTGRGIEPWRVELDDYAPAAAGGRSLAQRIVVITPGGLQATLRIKKMDISATEADSAGLDLPLPPQIIHIPLDRSGNIATPELP